MKLYKPRAYKQQLTVFLEETTTCIAFHTQSASIGTCTSHQPPAGALMGFCFSVIRGYAEMVERRLKSVGLVVELHFHGTQPISELLDDVARRGVLYAIVITSQHEVHRSVTVNILHGTPQGKEQNLLPRIKKHTGKRYIGDETKTNTPWDYSTGVLCRKTATENAAVQKLIIIKSKSNK